jgi:hypothetical protein
MDRLPRFVLVSILLAIGANGVERALTARSMTALTPPNVPTAFAALLAAPAPPSSVPPPPPVPVEPLGTMP